MRGCPPARSAPAEPAATLASVRRRPVPPPVALAVAAAVALAALPATGCGGGGKPQGLGSGPTVGRSGAGAATPAGLGFPAFATKNTTRVGGADPVANAAAVARAVYPGGAQRPQAVVLAPSGDWRAGLAAAPLVARPLRAPILLAGAGELPGASAEALLALRPTGAPAAAGARLVQVGDVADPPERLKTVRIAGSGPAELAAAVDRFRTTTAGRPSEAVMVVSQDAPAYAMPAAAWAAKSGDAILYVTRDAVPAATRRALRAHDRPRIYVLGPPATVSARVERALGRLGRVRRIPGRDPVSAAIAFARFSDGAFGWRVVDPGHGLSFASARQPLDAVAAAPLAGAGAYGPLLLLDRPSPVPRAVQSYLLDIQPGYTDDPVRGVYNHGWLIGDERAISLGSQSLIDQLLEIAPVSAGGPAP